VTKLMTAALAAAAFAVTAFAGSGAEAAFNVRIAAPQGLSMLEKTGCHGGGGYYIARRHHHIVRHSVKPKVQVAHVRGSTPVSVAKIEEPKPQDTAVPAPETTTPSPEIGDNSTITPADETASELTGNKTADQAVDATQAKTDETAEAKPANVDKDKEKVANKDLGCKAFFPAIGMTLTVPCK
jgi:hypothetical protein